jgi:hypothetical protein
VKNNGANAHMIGTDTPGMAYLTGEEGAQVTRFRSFFISGEDMETLPARALRRKPSAATSAIALTPDPSPTDLPDQDGYDPGQILPPRVETFIPRDWLADTTPSKVVHGCDEHRGKSGIDALEAAHACPDCMELPRGKDGD